MLFAATIAIEQEIIAADIPLRLYYIYTLRMYTNTARSIEAEQRLCSEAVTSDEVGLLQNFRTWKWIPFSFNF